MVGARKGRYEQGEARSDTVSHFSGPYSPGDGTGKRIDRSGKEERKGPAKLSGRDGSAIETEERVNSELGKVHRGFTNSRGERARALFAT